jgi:two-component system nitrogen regulation response regulator NtrX
VVDDEAGIRRSLSAILSDEGYLPLTACNGEECLTTMSAGGIDLVLLDIWMEGQDGIEVLKEIKARYPKVPVVMMSGHGTIETAVSTLKLGAYDYLEKPLSLDRVTVTIEHALTESKLSRENMALKRKVGARWQMVGDTPRMQQLKSQIVRIAASCARTLITGENGSGKELIARALHENSPRAGQRFVEINCAALPEHLIESELFGFQKGAFSGADRDKPGMFELADHGTLFLDEVGDMSLPTQARVLRVLQEGRFQRLGDTAPREVDVWVISATNRNLTQAIADGTFREDLFFRLNVIPIQAPALNERREDIPALVKHFADRAVAEQGLTAKKFAPEVMEVLTKAPWPGNVRELKNIVERLIIMSLGNQIGIEDLPDEMSATRRSTPNEFQGMPLREARELFEVDHIKRALAACGGNISRAADRLGVERSNLSKKIRQLGIGPGQT